MDSSAMGGSIYMENIPTLELESRNGGGLIYSMAHAGNLTLPQVFLLW